MNLKAFVESYGTAVLHWGEPRHTPAGQSPVFEVESAGPAHAEPGRVAVSGAGLRLVPSSAPSREIHDSFVFLKHAVNNQVQVWSSLRFSHTVCNRWCSTSSSFHRAVPPNRRFHHQNFLSML